VPAATEELQGLILDAGKESGLITAEVIESCRKSRREKDGASPLLKLLVERQGLSKVDLDRILEKFWAQNGARRAVLHREVEDRLIGRLLLEAGTCNEKQIEQALRGVMEREKGGQVVRLLSILIETGSIAEDKAREKLAEVQQGWKFCRYCLSTFESRNGADACGVCGRPLVPCARSYEIVSLSTFSTDTAPNKAIDAEKAGVSVMPEVGETLAGVKLLEKVDAAGRGVVFRAERLTDQAPRAVKVFQVGGDLTLDDVNRFESAALSAAKLDHPGILKVFEAGEERGVHFVLSEWVEGKTLLRTVADGGPLDPEQAALVLEAAAKALEAAHKEKLLHKNVTPGNLFVLDAGGVKLSDFGICKDYGVSMETVRGNLIGSPDYLAPEQCEGKRSDERTDIFSLGAALYFALTGKKPYEGDSDVAIVVKRLTSDPKPILEVAPKVPKELAKIVERMMARKVEDRPESMTAVLEALTKWREGRAARAAGAAGLRKKAALAAAVLFVGAGLAAAGYWITHRGPDPALVAAVKAAEEIAERGAFTDATDRLKMLLLSEGSPNGVAAQALERVGAKALEKADGLAKEKKYAAALDLVRAVRPSLGGGAAVKADELQRELEQKNQKHLEDAKAAWEDLKREVDALGPDEALARVRAYRERFPHQPLDQAAEMDEKRYAEAVRQLELLGEAETAVEQKDIDAAHAKLADLSMTQVPLSEKLEKRKRAVEVEIEFLTRMQAGDGYLKANDTEKAIGEYQRALAAVPGRQEARQAIANANYLALLARAEDAERAKDLVQAVDLYRKAERAAADAGVDPGPVRERIAATEKRRLAEKDIEIGRQAKVEQGDRAAKAGNWPAAYAAYVEARKLGTYPDLEEKIAAAKARLGAGEEEKAYRELDAKLAKTKKAAEKVELCRGFLDLYPDGTFSQTVVELLERYKQEGKVLEEPAAAAVAKDALRRGDREREWISTRDGAVMVQIPAGKVRRGTTAEQAKALGERWKVKTAIFADELPARDIAVDAFYMDVYEVTNADYALFLASIAADREKPHRFCHPEEPKEKDHTPKYWTDERWARPDLPVVGVDWWDAYAYAHWAGKRLPTEAEWERAARGDDARVFPWGDAEEPFFANSAEAWVGHPFNDRDAWRKEFFDREPYKEKGLTVTGLAFPGDRSPFGVMAMGGNVREWCEDVYAPDGNAKSDDKNPLQEKPVPLGKTKEVHRVVRGGSWNDCLLHLRAGSRIFHQKPDVRSFYVGFRCARSAEK
jgi:formylglycine-generating enzyme required for sulfatase activity